MSSISCSWKSHVRTLSRGVSRACATTLWTDERLKSKKIFWKQLFCEVELTTHHRREHQPLQARHVDDKQSIRVRPGMDGGLRHRGIRPPLQLLRRSRLQHRRSDGGHDVPVGRGEEKPQGFPGWQRAPALPRGLRRGAQGRVGRVPQAVHRRRRLLSHRQERARGHAQDDRARDPRLGAEEHLPGARVLHQRVAGAQRGVLRDSRHGEHEGRAHGR